jgi:hypothetical protein
LVRNELGITIVGFHSGIPNDVTSDRRINIPLLM